MNDHPLGITGSGRRKDAVLLLLFVALGALLSIWGASNHLFWDDEANTAIFARNLLKTGRLTAWDGVNLMGYRLGAELDENLENTYMPPLQYYVAALGQWLFGGSTLAGRILFILAGLAGLVMTGFFTREYLGEDFPWVIPPAILSLTPAYLMYIRQCRYYSLGALLCILLLYFWVCRLGRRPFGQARRLAGFFCVILLFSASYLNAAALLAVLPLFWLHRAYRTRSSVGFLTFLYSAACIAGTYVYFMKNPFAAEVAWSDPTPAVERFFTLAWWHLRGLGTFEFFPVALVPLLLLPWVWGRCSSLRQTAAKGWVLVAAMIGFTLVTALFSPQPVSRTRMADMRYVVPLIAVGSVVTAIAVAVAWKASKGLAVAVALLTILTNGAHLGCLQGGGFGSTLKSYVFENLNDYQTSTEAIVDYLSDLPDGAAVEISPDYMAYSPMFYLPGLRYCCQLTAEKTVDESLRKALPGYIFTETARPDLIIAHQGTPPLAPGYLDQRFGPGQYAVEGFLPGHWLDTSRPEIPLHTFAPAPDRAMDKNGYIVIKSTHFRYQ